MTTYLPRTSIGSIPPSYTPQDIELSRLDSPSPSASTILSEPPSYTEAASSFHPTVHLQIETEGKSWRSLPLPPDNIPIQVFSLHPQESSSSLASQATPTFTSFRPERFSGSCYLVSSDTTPSASESDLIPALATTTYRCGPNRPPRVRLFSPHSAPLPPAALESLLYPKKNKHQPAPESEPEQHQQQSVPEPWDDFTITSLGLLTRAVTFRTRLGTFEWRYASRRERHAVARACGQQISSLLVLERVTRIVRAQNMPSSSSSSSHLIFGGSSSRKDGGGEDTVRTRVAHFIRGEGTRTPGTSARDAGNGGRLVVDLGLWDGEGDGESKVDREMAGVLVVVTCLVMLKREVDRRRAQQAAIIAGAVSGGS